MSEAGVVWRLAAVRGKGWVREMFGDHPIITADPEAAGEWPTKGAALEAIAVFNSRRGVVPVRSVAGPARLGGPRIFDPTPRNLA